MVFDLRVLRQLRREADAGWEPAEATDFAALWATGRVRVKQVCRLLDLLLGSMTYRLRNPRPRVAPMWAQ